MCYREQISEWRLSDGVAHSNHAMMQWQTAVEHGRHNITTPQYCKAVIMDLSLDHWQDTPDLGWLFLCKLFDYISDLECIYSPLSSVNYCKSDNKKLDIDKG